MTVTEYRRPTSVEEATALLAERGDDAKVMAGGQSLSILLRLGLIEASTLVGLSGIAALDRLVPSEDGLHVGARVTHRQVQDAPVVRARWTVLAESAGAVATPQIRNQGTLCGNAAHGYPLADPPAALLALGASAHIRGADGDRVVPLDAFFVDFMSTALQPTELLTHITVPPPAPGSGGTYEVFRLRALDYPTVGVAVQLTMREDGLCRAARIGLNGAAPTTIRARRAEALLADEILETKVLAAAAQAAAEESDPADDVDGSAAYKRRLVGVLLRRAVRRAAERAMATFATSEATHTQSEEEGVRCRD
jgi:carbon-monoxide dehydrogenase medium subunit